MHLYKCSNKCVLAVKNNAAEFIKQYTSNTAEAPRNAFLDLRGRIVALFDQKLISENEVLVVMERQFVPRLRRHLQKYLFLTNTILDNDSRQVYFDIDGTDNAAGEEVLIYQPKGCLRVTGQVWPSGMSDEAFTLFRLQNNIPWQGVDFDDELLLEVDDEKAVSFTKGCYLGQEIIARVHHRGRPARTLVVLSEEERLAKGGTPLTSKALDPASEYTLGFSFVPQKSIDR